MSAPGNFTDVLSIPLPALLVMDDGISQLLDKPVQGFDIIDILQESKKSTLFRKWLEFCNDPIKLPEDGVST